MQLVDSQQHKVWCRGCIVCDVQVQHLLEHNVIRAQVGTGRHHGEQSTHIHAQCHVVYDFFESLLLGMAQLLAGPLASGAQPLQLRLQLS
jgi:hypothetical protein